MAAEAETCITIADPLYKSVAAIPTQKPGDAHTRSQWGRLLGSRRTLFPGGIVTPFCRSPCSEMARLKPRPLMDPRCHLQMSPFRMSWMCCTMRLMATDDNRHMDFVKHLGCWRNELQPCEGKKNHLPILSTPLGIMTSAYFLVWKKKICIKDGIKRKNRHILTLITIILTGKQNSSKAGLTNVVYWERICSRSRPLLMSRRTTGKMRSTHCCTVRTGLLCVMQTAIPLRDSLTSESVSTKSFMWNIFRTFWG